MVLHKLLILYILWRKEAVAIWDRNKILCLQQQEESPDFLISVDSVEQVSGLPVNIWNQNIRQIQYWPYSI